MKRIIKFLFVIYIIVLLVVLFLYGGRRGNQFGLDIFSREHFMMANCIPFATVISYFERLRENTINTDIVVRNFAANLLMFVPMGIALPVLFINRFNKWWKVLLFVTVLVLLIEIVQFVTFTGSADIDDLIFNVAGAMIGYAIIQIKTIRRLLLGK